MTSSPRGAATRRMPVLFVGHGSPMNVIEETPWSRAWRDLGERLPRPRAILAVSAHWYTEGSFLTGQERPRTIHDFGGFPRALYEIRYGAPGAPALAARAAELLGTPGASVRGDWGLDHGTWSVLVHMYPAADIPVVQLSLDLRLPPREHLRLGGCLAPLRDEGVLLLSSGNITHNLPHAFAAADGGEREPPAWARAFDGRVAGALEARDWAFLQEALHSQDGRLSHPTPDHYLPLLYTAGASAGEDSLSFPTEGFDMASLSMRAVLFGAE